MNHEIGQTDNAEPELAKIKEQLELGDAMGTINNFRGYLPDGIYRVESFFKPEPDQEVQDLIKDGDPVTYGKLFEEIDQIIDDLQKEGVLSRHVIEGVNKYWFNPKLGETIPIEIESFFDLQKSEEGADEYVINEARFGLYIFAIFEQLINKGYSMEGLVI